MQTKSPGISIVIAVGISLFISSLVLGTMISIGRSFDREVELGRSLQFYYASESGIEAALFHKNARGKGIHLPATTTAAQDLQRVRILGDNIESSWALNARANKIVGLLREQNPIEINLYYPVDQDIDDTPTTNLVELDNTQDFNFTFYENSADLPDDIETLFVDEFGTVNIKDYPLKLVSGNDEPFIDWSAKRLGSNGYELFRPTVNENGAICHGGVESSEIAFRGCKSEILDNATDIHILSSQDPGTGTHQEPALGLFTSGVGFMTFLDLGNPIYTHRSISVAPLGVFIKDPDNNTAPDKIPGIPYSVTLDNTLVTDEVFPQSRVFITTQVRESGGFALENQIQINEKVSSSDFNYVMFD